MAFKRAFSPTLDGDYVEVPNPGGSTHVSIHFDVGEYALPFWLQVQDGPVVKVTELPFRTVLKAPE